MNKKLILFILYFFFLNNTAHAYIDPGIFSFIWQGIVLILTSIFCFFSDIKTFLIKIFNKIKTKSYLKNKKD